MVHQCVSRSSAAGSLEKMGEMIAVALKSSLKRIAPNVTLINPATRTHVMASNGYVSIKLRVAV